MSDGQELLERARTWAAGDPDPETRAELESLIGAESFDELAEAMGTLAFGTAGLRGVVAAGSGRMNHAVVIRTTRGLAEWLRRRASDTSIVPVLVGHDARLTSRALAEETIAVLTAANIPVQYFDQPVPTPLVAYALRRLGGNAAVVITASHNPPEYN